MWRQFAIFFGIFLVHNFLIAPLLVYRQRRALYCSVVTAILAGFILYQCTNRPAHMEHRKPPMAQHERQGEAPPDEVFFDEAPTPPEERGSDEAPTPPDGLHPMPPKHLEGSHQPPHGHRQPSPGFMDMHDIVAVVILILMLGMNLGIKFFFKTRDDRKRLLALEKQNLEQQLEYLKYQINPHFFMNTLNNIHALVDIDPEKAQHTILELSKMMRFVLYEGNKQGVPLSREFDFIRNYLTLMKLRYTDKVRIDVSLPSEVPDLQIPPLMLITFIENAFKHGISYQHDSFIDICVTIGQRQLHFQCRNSRADSPVQEKGGVGLANVKQRLNLLYDNNYTLSIQDEADIYNVELTIPLEG